MLRAWTIGVLVGLLVLTEGAPASAAPGATDARSGGPILHRPVNTVLSGRAVHLRARLGEDSLAVAQLRLYYRWGHRGPFLRKVMRVDGRGAFLGCVPGARVAATTLQYYLTAVDVRGRRRGGYGTPGRPVQTRVTLAPSPPFARPGQTCPDGVGQREDTAGPTRAQLRQVRLRKRALAAEAHAQRLRNAGRTLVYGSLVAVAVGGGFIASGLSQGQVFLWVGVSISGVAALMTIIGAPLWITGIKKLRRARQQLVRPRATLPADVHRQHQRWWALPGRSPRTHQVLSWRLRF